MRLFRHRLLVVLASAVGLAACGPGTNILGLTVPDEHKESFAFLLTEAHQAYDDGDLGRAFDLSGRAFGMAPDSERAALLYGFVNLSLAGGDPYKIARALVGEEKKNPEEGEGDGEGEGEAEGGGEDDAGSDALAPLRRVIGLRGVEIEQIATLDTSDPELPLYLPRCAEDARQALVRLQHVERAIRAACRFVDVEARIEGDYRQRCDAFTGDRRQKFRAHFLWAFAHLTEALAFQSVLSYGVGDEAGSQSNLEKRVAKIRASAEGGGPAAVISAMQSLRQTLGVMMPTSGRCSDSAPTTQLRATLNDLLAVDAALERLPGLSPDIGKSLKAALRPFTGVDSGSSDPTQQKIAQTKALRQDLTKGVSGSLGQTIDGLAEKNGGALPPEQKTELCGTYVDIAAGGELPAACR